MSLSSAAFFSENFADGIGIGSRTGTAKAPLMSAALSCGLAVSACELGSSLPIFPDGVCCAFSCCNCCCGNLQDSTPPPPSAPGTSTYEFSVPSPFMPCLRIGDALNTITRRGKIATSLPVFGLRPILWLLLRTTKEPKEDNFTVSPRSRQSVISFSTSSTNVVDSVRDNPTF
jgi:hypothetical protein